MSAKEDFITINGDICATVQRFSYMNHNVKHLHCWHFCFNLRGPGRSNVEPRGDNISAQEVLITYRIYV